MNAACNDAWCSVCAAAYVWCLMNAAAFECSGALGVVLVMIRGSLLLLLCVVDECCCFRMLWCFMRAACSDDPCRYVRAACAWLMNAVAFECSGA